MKGRGIGMVKLRERISVKDVGASDWGCDLQYRHACIYGSGQHSAGRCVRLALMDQLSDGSAGGSFDSGIKYTTFNTGLVLSQPPFRRHNGSSEHRMLSDSGSGGGSHLPGV